MPAGVQGVQTVLCSIMSMRIVATIGVAVVRIHIDTTRVEVQPVRILVHVSIWGSVAGPLGKQAVVLT